MQLLLDEQVQLHAALTEQDCDPELIERIRYCIGAVIKAGEEPRQRKSIRAQLKTQQNKQNADTKEEILINRKATFQLQ